MAAQHLDEHDNILTQAGLYIDSEGILQYADDNANMLYSRIQQTASSIMHEVEDVYNGLYTRITQTASEIRSDVADVYNGLYTRITQTASEIRSDVADVYNGLYTRIVQTASDIRSEVATETGSIRTLVRQTASSWESRVEGVVDENGNITAASISVAINADGSHAKIEADHIDIDGLVTALAAKSIGVGSLTVEGQTTFKNYVYSEAAISCEEDISAASFTAGLVTLKVADITFSGNTMTVSYCDGRDPVNFSKATTLSVEYGGDAETDTATFTVTGTPAENFPSGNTAVGTFTVHQNKLAAYILDGAGTLRARIDNPQYSNGWSAAYGKVDLPTTSSTAQSFTIKTPPSTVDGEAKQTTYMMNNAQKNVATVTNPVGTVVARLEHNRYNGGWSAAYGKVSLPTTSSTATSFTIETPPSTVDGNADSTTYTMNNAQLNVATVTNPSGTVVARLEHNRYTEGYNAGGATAWIESVGASHGTSQGQLTPGTYIAPSYVKYGASSATARNYRWYVPTAWLAFAGSAPAGTAYQGELAYDTIYFIRYQTPTGWDGNKWAGGYWKTKPDRWQEGYDAGAGSVSHSPTVSASFPWTGSIDGDRTSLGKVSYTSLRNSYILIDAKCGGKTKKYYITVN